MVVTGLCVIYLVIVYFHYNAQVLEFVNPTPSGAEGYDGQFTYYISADPLNAAPRLDVPAYRYQRILQPALVRLFAVGQEGLIPWAILGLDLAALALGTAMLEQLLVGERVNRWYALTYGLFGGIFF